MSKMILKKNEEENEPTEKVESATSYPKNSLLESLRIAQSIKDNNAGKPFNRLTLAKSLNYSPNGSSFRLLITSSRRYGLTKGNYNSEKVELTPLGESAVSPRSDEEKNVGLKTALFNVAIFQKFFSDFNGNKIPRADLIINTLSRDYGLDLEDSKAVYQIIMKNAEELSIIEEIKGSRYIQLDKLCPVDTPASEEVEDEVEPLRHKEQNQKELLGKPRVIIEDEEKKTEWKPRVFISHSKNLKILEQLKNILNFGQFDFEIAKEHETTAIPISEKVFGHMRKCNCAIINISADANEKREDGTYGINPNVLIEIGAAFLKYEKRVILLVDERLKVPSNLEGLYRCEYEGDELSFDLALKLQEALQKFREPVQTFD